jgi:hypothetical protein
VKCKENKTQAMNVYPKIMACNIYISTVVLKKYNFFVEGIAFMAIKYSREQ